MQTYVIVIIFIRPSTVTYFNLSLSVKIIDAVKEVGMLRR